ncbi:unnamed protein product [Alternaria alternata]
MVPSLTDILDQFDNEDLPDLNMIPVKVRSAMAATSNLSPQGRLWTSQPIKCGQAVVKSDATELPMNCVLPNMAFGNMSLLPDPFFAELPADYSTGLIRQYLPRMNSTAHRVVITEPEFPTNCADLPGAFYVRYAATNPNYITMTGWGNWSLEVCMPANLTQSPWRAVRTRQDITEELYLNISLVSADPMQQYVTPEDQGGMFRISLDTTLGYFELPNYMNGEQPGPLLNEDPTNHCGGNCSNQAFRQNGQVANFVHSLYWNHYDGYKGDRITNAFTSAAFLANEAWLSSTAFMKTWSVTYDHGADTLVPVISRTGILVISVLLGVFLASLLGLAIYSAVLPRWTDQLDAFAMLRIGASISDKIQFRTIPNAQRVRVLDELPGWIGDAASGEDAQGELALGGSGRLGRKRKFAAYVVEDIGKGKKP